MASASFAKWYPENLVAGFGLIQALLTQQKTDAANRYLLRVLSLFKELPWLSRVTYHYLAAQRDLVRGMDLDDAEAALFQALKLHPEHPPSLMLMGWVKLQKGEAETAANYLTSYHAQKPDEPAGTRLLAEVFLRIGQASHAIEVLNRAVEQQSGDAQLVSLLGDAYQQTGDDAEAQEMLRLAVSMAPDSAPMRTRLAASLITSGEVAQGARELATVLASHPDDPQAEYLQAFALFKQGNDGGALAKAATARADTLVRSWFREHPEDVMARVALAKDLVRRGEPELATREFERALQYQPDNVLVLKKLAQLNGQAGEPQALEYARRAHELSPDDPQVQGTYGWLLTENEDPRQGLELLEAAIVKAPDNPEIRYHLAAALAITGDRYRARKELETILGMKQDVIDTGVVRRAMDDLVAE